MRMQAWTALLLSLGCGAASAQTATPDLPMCYYTTPPGTDARVELPGGFTVRLTRTSEPDATEESCTLRVETARGVVVYERSGFGARVLPAAGQDLDADGVPDAVLSVDDGGGNRCCWGTIVLRLAVPAAVVVDVPFPVAWQLDPPRGALAVETAAYYDLGPSMAEAPTVTRIYRLTASGLLDRTREFCDRILSRAATDGLGRRDVWPDLTLPRRRASRAGSDDDFEVSQTRVGATSIALQYLECGRAADAEALVDEVWPAAEAPVRRRRIAEAFAARSAK
jgi:hypothetical protein